MSEPNQSANDPGETSMYRPVPEGAGDRIGPYKLLQEIGEGGFGKVYMAEQQEPVRRKVALKIIKPGMDTKEVIARFESERQALALMDHPNIARVLDAGATNTGRPYFVMELVRGVPITEYCDKNSLTTSERLELFVTVCRAVQHAHQKGVIHRDLKPSNVMVTLHDGQPVPKVIDFGVAKATTQKLTERTMFTAYGQMIGTPAYMSPEQAEMSGLDIDTRSDIYSLGVVLYELLTGTTPFEIKRLRDASYIEMQRIIREEDPPKPSTRISTLGDNLTIIANHRRTDPAKLRQALSGDLDLIVMKALEKERGRRYETPNSFAQDIERFLRHEAIHARPQSAIYRLRKFSERNRAAVATATAVAICLLMGTVVSTILAIQAMKQRDRAEASLVETQKQRKLAEEAQAAAESERDRAEKAKQAEAGERERAEEQRRVAEDERRRAEEQQKVAEKERQDAVAARMAESDQKAAAERERDRAQALNDALNEQKEQQRRMLYVAQMNLIQKAWDAENVARVRELLQTMRPGPGETDLRGFEWHYWMRRTHEELSAGKLEAPPAYTGALSEDGTRFGAVVTTTATETQVVVCDTATGKKVFSKLIPFARRPGNDQRTHEVIFVNSDRVAVVSRQWVNLYIGSGGAADYAEYEARRKSARQTVTLQVLSLEGEGEELFRLETTAPVYAPTPFVFTRDGSKVAGIVSSGQQKDIVQIWEGRTGSEIAQRGIPFFVDTYDRRLAVSADGSRVALVASPNIGLNVAQFQFGMKILEMQSDKVVSPGGSSSLFQFSPNGSRLAMSSGGVVKVYDAATGDEVCRTAEARPSTTLALLEFSPDGRWLATAARMGEQPARTVKLWDAATGKAGPEFKGHTRPLAEIGFRDEGAELVSVERFGSIKSWRVPAATGSKATALREALGQPQSMSGTILRAFGVGLAQQSTEGPSAALKVLTDLGVLSGTRTGGGPQVRTIKARSADGRWIAGESVTSRTGLVNVAANSAEYSIAVEDTTRKLPGRVLKTSGRLTLALFSPDGSRLATGTAKPDGDIAEAAELKVWDVATGELQFAATMAAGEEQQQIRPSKARIFPAVADGTAFSANGRRLAIGYFETVNNQRALAVRVWDTSDGREIAKWAPTGLSGRVGGLQMSPDGETVLLGGTDNFDAYPQTTVMTTGKTSFNSTLSSVLQAWNATSGELRWRVTSPISLVRFSSDSRRVVGVVQAGWLFSTTANVPSAIVAWDAETGAEAMRIPLDRGRAYTRMAMSRDEKRVAVVGGATDSGSGDVAVYDIESGELVVRVQGHDGSIAGLAFSDNGSRLVTSAGLTRRYGDADPRSAPSQVGETKIWDVATGQELLALAGGSEAPKFLEEALGGDPAAPFRVAPSPIWNAARLESRVEAEEWVEYLLASGRQKGLVPRGELARQIEIDSSISEELRSAAVEQIRGLKRDAASLNSEAWAIAKQVGLPNADYERAIDYAREACEGRPDVVNNRNTLGVAQYRAGHFREAIATLEQCVEMRKGAKPPNHGADFMFLAMAHHQLGQGERSREYFRLADRAMQAGRSWSEWKTHLSEAETLLGMRLAMTHFTEGNALRDKRSYDKALAEYEEALRLDPESPWIFGNRAFVWHGKQDYVRAMLELDRAIQLEPNYDWAFALRGSVWRAQNQPERALADYAEAIRVNPDVVWYYNDRAAIHQAAERYDEAIKDYGETIRLEPRVAKHYLDRGYMKRLAGRLDESIKDYDEAIRIDPRNLAIWNTRGVAHYRAGKFVEALADFEQSTKLVAAARRVPVPEDLVFLAMTHHQLGNAKQAAELLDRYRKIVQQSGSTKLGEWRGYLAEAEAVLGIQRPPPPPPQDIAFWGRTVDPAGDCEFVPTSDSLTIKVPGTLHSLTPANMNFDAPRVLQEVEGDFTVQVKVAFPIELKTPLTGRAFTFYGAGFLIWHDLGNLLRIERDGYFLHPTFAAGASVPTSIKPPPALASHAPLIEYIKKGIDASPTRNLWDGKSPALPGDSTWLRVTRRGARLDIAMSHDGRDWKDVQSVDTAFPQKIQLGVVARNNSASEFRAEFSELVLTRP